MKVYLVTRFNEEDYSVSYTGNYAGQSCTSLGIYTTLEAAEQRESEVGDWIGSTISITALELDSNEEVLLDSCMSYHNDDY